MEKYYRNKNTNIQNKNYYNVDNNRNIDNNKNIDKNIINNKKILCYNMLIKKHCDYGSKCLYAHSLSEQKIDSMRHKIYTLLRNDDDLKNLDLINDTKLFNGLTQLTKVCTSCIKKICPGGYNCKHGAINKKYRICSDDLLHGNCKRINCQSVHLTERNLIPYSKQKMKQLNLTVENNHLDVNNVWNKIPDSIFGNSYQNLDNNKKVVNKKKEPIKYKRNLDDLGGVLLTEKFLMMNFDRKSYVDCLSSDSEEDEDIESIMKYLNSNSD